LNIVTLLPSKNILTGAGATSTTEESMNLVFDLDDTLIEATKEIVAALNRVTGKAMNHQFLWNNDLSAVYERPMDEIQTLMVEHLCLERSVWSDTQLSWNHAVWRWAEAGHNVFYCTARDWHPDAKAITDRHLAAAGETPGTAVIVPYGVLKTEFLLNNNIRPDIMVDDSFEQVVNAATNGCTSLLFSRPWNNLKTWGNRVCNQAEIIQMVDAKIVERREYGNLR
jgi:5'(3')-deoxyribonucleotidase